MSTTSDKLLAYAKSHKLYTGFLAVSVAAIAILGSLVAFTNTTAATVEVSNKKPATSQSVANSPVAESAPEPADTNDSAAPSQASVADQPTIAASPATAPEPPAAPVGLQASATTAPAVTDIPAPAATEGGRGAGGPEQPAATPANPTAPAGTDPDTNTPAPATPVNPVPPVATPEPSVPAVAFDKARVSLTFDDGWKSIHSNGLPLLQKYGLVSTQYINSQPSLEGYSGYMTFADLADFAASGHEIAWHTNTHVYDLVGADAATRDAELTPNPSFLTQLMNVNVTLSSNYASPFGTHSSEVANDVTAHGFTSYRTTFDGFNTKGATDVMSIKVKNVCGVAGIEACNNVATTPEQVASWLAQAQASNAWLVLVFHEVDTAPNDPSYAITPDNLDASLNLIKNSGVTVQTVEQALTELRPQL